MRGGRQEHSGEPAHTHPPRAAKRRGSLLHWGRFSDRTPVEVSQVALEFARLPEAFDGFRIALLADIHYGKHVGCSFVRRVAEIVRQQRPDLLLVCGDLVDRPLPSRLRVVEMLGGLFAECPAYGVPGNHDYYDDPAPLWERLRQAGLEMLVNQWRPIRRAGAAGDEQAIALAGLDDIDRGRPDVQAALSSIPAGTFTILLGHSPDLADLVPARAAVDLMLCGHTHGGQVRLFGMALVTQTRNRRYLSGLIAAPDFPLYVSRGLGATGLPLRIGAESELPIVTLRRAGRRNSSEQ